MIHKDKVTETSTHHEQMKNFMAAEVFVKCVKYRKFQSIDYTTDGVDDAACQSQPNAACGRSVHSRVNTGRHVQPMAM